MRGSRLASSLWVRYRSELPPRIPSTIRPNGYMTTLTFSKRPRLDHVPATQAYFNGFRKEKDERNRHRCTYQLSVIQSQFSSASKVDTSDEDSTQQRSAETLRERASTMRDSAREHYRGFREHPGQSARQGAKSFGGMLQQYGPVFIGTYAAVYFATLGTLFLGVESGLMDPAGLFSMLGHNDAGETKNTVKLVVDFMEQYELTAKYAHIVEKRPEVANLAVAWIAVKFTEPLRLAVALGITPRIARYFGVKPKNVETIASKESPQS